MQGAAMKVRVSALEVQRMADSLRGCFSGESEEIGIHFV